MITVDNLIDTVNELSGHELYSDEGVHFGASDIEINGATLCWMATPEAIRHAGERGDNLLITHESLYYPYDAAILENPPEGWQHWKVNSQRRELLSRYNLTCIRLHMSVDEISIYDVFAEMLGLEKIVFKDEGLIKVFEIPEIQIGDLIVMVKDIFKMPAVRVSGNFELDKIVKRVGLPWGGLGLFVNVAYQQRLIENNCDVFIAGESDNYGFRFSAECGIPMIETSHEISENPGLLKFMEILNNKLPDINIDFFENPCIWKMH